MNRARIASFVSKTCIASLVIFAASSSISSAQRTTGYRALPVSPDFKESIEFKRLTILKSRVLVGSEPYQTSKNDISKYYGYLFRAMTQLDALDKLPAIRQEMLSDLKRARTNEVHAELLGMIFRGMKVIAAPQVTIRGVAHRMHPAVRFNAILTIGDLNELESKGVQQPVPDPYRPAFDYLVAELKKTDQLDAIKMAAMLGIMRHAELDWARKSGRIDGAKRADLVNLMVTLVSADSPPDGRSEAGHVWMQRRAVEILGALGAIGRRNEANAAVVSVLANEDADSSLRCSAARILGLLEETSPAKVDPAATSKDLGVLAARICRNELKWIEDLQEKDKQKLLKSSGASGMGGYPGGMDGGGGYPGMGGGDEEEGGYGGYPGMGGPGGMGMPGMGGPGGMSPPGGGGGYPGMGGGYPGMGGYGTSATIPKDPRLDLARRRLKYQLVCVRDGLDGVIALAGESPAKSDVDGINEKFTAIMEATDPPEEEPTLDALAKQLRSATAAMEQLTGTEPVDAEIDEGEIGAAPGGEVAADPEASPATESEDTPASAPGS